MLAGLVVVALLNVADPDVPEEAGPDARVIELAKQALEADKNDQLDECIAKDRAALEIEDHSFLRLHLASCLGRTGRLIDALRAAKEALELAMHDGDEKVKELSRKRITELLRRIPHVSFRKPATVPNTKIEFDNRPVPEPSEARRFAIDPGEHIVSARGGDCLEYDEHVVIAEGTDRVIDLELTRPPQLDEQCRFHEGSSRVMVIGRIGLEMSAYADTNDVNVLTPALNASVFSPTHGWGFGASYAVDFISSASPDVVSTASPRYHETRHVVKADGGYKFGDLRAELRTKISSESDCRSITGGGAFSLDMNDKLFTPRIGYAHREDTIGVSGTPFSAFEHQLSINEFEAGATFVLTPTTLLVTAATLETMRGDPSNPYRYVPLFSPDVAGFVPAGATVDVVNATRLPLHPREQLPAERDRFAMAARLNRRLSSGSLRLEERVYVDTWGIKASSSDVRYLHSFSRVELGPHLRFHVQSGANFYRLAYAAVDTVPAYRTTQRELSPFFAVTVGALGRVRLNAVESAVPLSLLVSADVLHGRYSESLYLTSRTAVYGTLGFEAEL